VEPDVRRHDLQCPKDLCGLGSASNRGEWRASDGRSPSAQDAGLPGTALFRQRAARSDYGDRRPQAALRPCPWWAKGLPLAILSGIAGGFGASAYFRKDFVQAVGVALAKVVREMLVGKVPDPDPTGEEAAWQASELVRRKKSRRLQLPERGLLRPSPGFDE
jgi:hypothetical protein